MDQKNSSLSPPASSYRARFHDPVVEGNASGELRLSCTLENKGSARWSANQNLLVQDDSQRDKPSIGPISLGYHIFDARTGALIMEADHTALINDLSPGEKFVVQGSIQLPLEEGDYRILVSPVHENVAWFSDHGSEFLLVDVSSTPSGIQVRRVFCTNRENRGNRRAWQLISRFFVYPLQTIHRYHSLIFSLVRRDISGRYRGSVGGILWTVMHPLLLMLAYYFVFAIVLRVRFATETSSGAFIFYFLCGMLPWLAFSEAIGRAPGVVSAHSGFVKRVVFPLEILPINLTLAGLVTQGIGLVIFLAALVVWGGGIPSTAALFPMIFLPQVMLTAGLCWFLAAVGVFFKDTNQIMGFVLTLWFFATPICYPASALPANWIWLFELNPMYTMVEAYRSIFLETSLPSARTLAALWAISLASFWAGYAIFYKTRRTFADLL
ncbi:MAG: hypothetical protein A3F68_09195 [Acidobacteria bacterium RIFCSPLOWO2_12_FULL_54_10]|nr:MAG: hypothetical protein A3F68_09195 [Acidobacteria bacterium RIFCSPLOWO2_12_FULL_54_10]